MERRTGLALVGRESESDGEVNGKDSKWRQSIEHEGVE